MNLPLIITKEIEGEKRISVTPETIKKFKSIGFKKIFIEKGSYDGIFRDEKDYLDESIEITDNKNLLYSQSGVFLKINKISENEIKEIKSNSIIITTLFSNITNEIKNTLQNKKITSFFLEFLPRISRAQTLDILSSQSSVIGYKAAILAANNSPIFFPHLTTAAGTIRPAKILVIGAGVAGLQAISTCKMLGAKIEGYDIRKEAIEQIESLGAKAIYLDIKCASTESGYAKELSINEKEEQNKLLKKHICENDIIITTAGTPGKKAPIIITKNIIELMKPGSIIIDAMADVGGNCEITSVGNTVNYKNVKVIGPKNIPSQLSISSSTMISNNFANFLKYITKNNVIEIDINDEIISSTMITHSGKITI